MAKKTTAKKSATKKSTAKKTTSRRRSTPAGRPSSARTAAVSSATIDRIIARLQEIENGSGDGTVQLSRDISLDVTHLAKVYFPKPGVTKGEIMRYYASVWPYLRPVIADRPLSLKRFPEGVAGEFFFQQKAPPNAPDAVRVETVHGVSGDQSRIVGGSLGTTLYCTQIGAFECNPWNVRVQSIDQPDFTVIDLDPGEKSPFSRVVEVALWVREALDFLGLHAGVKTSGATGLHIVIPLPAGSTDATAERVPRLIAEAVASAHPKSATVVRGLAARGSSRIYVDYGQNARGKTVASAYSVRARAEASVSAPLEWDELRPGLDPREFTVRTMLSRLEAVGDLWAAAMKTPNPARIVTTL